MGVRPDAPTNKTIVSVIFHEIIKFKPFFSKALGRSDAQGSMPPQEQ
jgi:hypothetical protein